MSMRFLLYLFALLCLHIPAHAGVSEPVVPITGTDYPQSVTDLGARLFHDPGISRSGTMSCASCHPVSTATADGLPFSPDNAGNPMPLNTPGLNYVTLNYYFTWNGRFPDLEAHLDGLIRNPRLFDNTWERVILYLESDEIYRNMFRDAGYPGITQASVTDAIITFEKSLVRPSRFDFYLQGNRDSLSDQEIRGYQLFRDYGCIACHQGQNLGGNMRQKFGVMRSYFDPSDNIQKRDLGYYNHTGREEDKFSFRVPGLRNVSQTAPYFHDASAATLSDAIAIMFEYQLGRKPVPQDVADIEAFLKSLDALK